MTDTSTTAGSAGRVLLTRAGAGAPEGWYPWAARNVVRLLSGETVRVQEIPYPEQLKTDVAARAAGLDGGPYPHLIFETPDAIRPLRGHRNIACFGWGYDVIRSDGGPDEFILQDHVRMLSLCDEVWTPSSYAQDVLARHGIEAVRVPAPIFLPAERRGSTNEALRFVTYEAVELVTSSGLGKQEHAAIVDPRIRALDRHARVRRAVEPDGRVFLTICDPRDRAKNLASLIEGYLMAAEQHQATVLLVGVPAEEGDITLAEVLFERVAHAFGHPHCLEDERVIFVAQGLPETDWSPLYRLADFYLSASLAEVQNIPLLEAAAHGCVPVSVIHTAMADYLDDENAVVIPHRRYPGLVNGLPGDLAHRRYAVGHCDRYQIASAVSAAMSLDAAEHASKQAAATAAVTDQFAADVVFEHMASLLGLSRRGCAETTDLEPAAVQG